MVILLVGGDSLQTFPLLQKAPFDVVRDFSPISLLASDVRVIVVHPSLPVHSVKELIALAKSKLGELNYASSTPGGPAHLATELLKFMVGIDIVNVPYKGTAAGVTAVIGGHVHLTIADAATVAPHTKSCKLRPLAVTSAKPSALVPGLPTVAASGLPGYEMVGQTSLYAPIKTPSAIINRLNQEVVRFVNVPEIKERLLKTGQESVGSSPEELAASIHANVNRMGTMIKTIGLRLD